MKLYILDTNASQCLVIFHLHVFQKTTVRKPWPYGNCTHGETEEIVLDLQQNTTYSMLVSIANVLFTTK